MIIFDVYINGKPVQKSGKSDLTVMSSIVHAVGVLGPDSTGVKHKPDGYEIKLDLGGLTSSNEEMQGVHLSWLREETLNVGDEVTIRILDANDPGPHITPTKADIEKVIRSNEKEENRRYERAKKDYFELRDKYEANDG
jgi:hypothetical protein